MRNALRGMTGFSAVVAASPAFACAVCGAGRDDAIGKAFFTSTLILSLVPVGIIVATMVYIFRSVRRRNESAAREASVTLSEASVTLSEASVTLSEAKGLS